MLIEIKPLTNVTCLGKSRRLRRVFASAFVQLAGHACESIRLQTRASRVRKPRNNEISAAVYLEQSFLAPRQNHRSLVSTIALAHQHLQPISNGSFLIDLSRRRNLASSTFLSVRTGALSGYLGLQNLKINGQNTAS